MRDSSSWDQNLTGVKSVGYLTTEPSSTSAYQKEFTHTHTHSYIYMYIYTYQLPECSIQEESFAFKGKWQPVIPHWSAQPPVVGVGKYIYIYIYILLMFVNDFTM